MPPVNNVWASTPAENAVEEITLPSGQVCHARRMGLETMIAAGLLGEADSLSAVVGDKHITRVREAKGNKVKEELSASSMMRDPKALQRIVLLVDRATPFIVAEPRVVSHVEILEEGKGDQLPVTRLVENREPGVIYTDQIGLEDKMFLFNFAVGGTRDLERFRSESDAAVAGVEHGEGVPHTAQRTNGGGGKRRRRR